MKIHIYFSILLACTWQFSICQHSCPIHTHDQWLMMNDSIELRGQIHALKSTSIMFHGVEQKILLDPLEFEYKHINYVASRKKGSILKGQTIGGLIGATAGIIIGRKLARTNRCSTSISETGTPKISVGGSGFIDASTIALSTVMCTALGVTIGSGIGNSSKKYRINSNKKSKSTIQKDLEWLQCKE